MKLKKTPKGKRNIFRYEFQSGDDVTIRPGENGVTNELIRILYSMDDSEVYNNKKNTYPTLTKMEKETLSEWEQSYPNEESSVNINISIDYCMENEQSEEARAVLNEISTTDIELSPDIMRLKELVETLSPLDKSIYKSVILKEKTYSDTADELNISISDVHYHITKIKEYIKNNM